MLETFCAVGKWEVRNFTLLQGRFLESSIENAAMGAGGVEEGNELGAGRVGYDASALRSDQRLMKPRTSLLPLLLHQRGFTMHRISN